MAKSELKIGELKVIGEGKTQEEANKNANELMDELIEKNRQIEIQKEARKGGND